MDHDPSRDRAALRLAAIDVGTNSVRLVVAEVKPDRSYRIIDEEKVVTRLGRGLSAKGVLDERAMDESAVAIAHLRSIAVGCAASSLRAVATCAVREATNGEDFVRVVQERAGVDLEVISSEDEARLAFRSVTNAFDLRGMGVAVIDVGGGSTEIVLSSDGVVERIGMLRVGAVRLTEAVGLGSGPVSDRQYQELRRLVVRELRRAVGKLPFVPQLAVGTGGTFTNLAAMSMHGGAPGRDSAVLPFAIRGYEMKRSAVKHFLERLAKMSGRDRARLPGLNPDRADIIVAGLTIVDRTLKYLGANRLRVHDEGIRGGLLNEMIDERMPVGAEAAREPPDRLRAVRQFAATCHDDLRHSGHVAEVALMTFDGLAREVGDADDGVWATPRSRGLLHAASLLHDVGNLINYSKHHKHSYHLVMHSGLPGFTRRELQVVANVARYHRGARPKTKHSNFAELPVEERCVVRRLAAILRLAAGLDRSHAQRVQELVVRRSDDAVLFEVVSDEDPRVELWGAERRSRLFEEVFGLKPHFRWVSPTGAHEREPTGAAP